MKHKDYEPISFKFFQTDMEKILFFLNRAIALIDDEAVKYNLQKIKDDIEHKVNMHREWGEWIDK